MCIVSFYKEALNITIHNQCPKLELLSLVYFCDGTACHVPPIQQIGTDKKMEASFGINSKQQVVQAAFLYKLQKDHLSRLPLEMRRKITEGTDNQLDSSATSTNDTTPNIYLLVACYIGWHEYGFYACLIECANDYTWDENKLWVFYREYRKEICKNCKDKINTWLMNDGTLIKTKLDVSYGSDYKLNIVISEGTRIYNMKKPLQFDLKRLVLS
jgi:hypothetical protein